MSTASGSAILDFGATPTDTASLAISDSGISSTSLVDAWIVATATTDHNVDEHWVENLYVKAGNISAGVGFTIYGRATAGFVSGKFTVHWARYN